MCMSAGASDDSSKRLLMELLQQKSGQQSTEKAEMTRGILFERGFHSGQFSGTNASNCSFKQKWPGHDFTINANFGSMDASSYNGLVIPGGRAPKYLALDDAVIKLVKEFMESRNPVASICHGQQILSTAGILKVTLLTSFRIEVKQLDACMIFQIFSFSTKDIKVSNGKKKKSSQPIFKNLHARK
ncbi:protein dj-1 -like d [Nicotiana attenuata]|uniref:Protein dj-1 -like d n=1 Tax=Nicotiana attenuata TaxID=49451 RepID=A0A1J6J429_NICAT|nr:protein dj-1 -like d [Nicotiana attenuata]